MAGYGIGAFGSGFASGFGLGETIKAKRAETKRADEKNAREQQEFTRKEDDIQQVRALGDQITQHAMEFLGSQSGQEGPPPQGISPEPVGPPSPDGRPAAVPEQVPGAPGISAQAPAAQGQPAQGAPATTRRPMGYMDALDDSMKYLQKTAPLYLKLFSIADPQKAAAYAEKLGDVKTQQHIAEEVAVGRLLLSNPNSEEAKQALMKFYDRIPDGRQIDPATYQVMGNGTLKFNTFDPRDPQGSRKPELLEPARIRAMTMRSLTAPQLATALQGQDTVTETKRYHDAQITNMERDDTRREREFKETSRLRGVQIDAYRDAKKDAAETKAEAAKAKERDEIMRGIDNVTVGDPKTFDQRPEEDRTTALGRRGSALALLDSNPERFKGKGASVGARALDVADSIAAGKARLLQDDSDPQTVIAEIGNVQYKLPASSYVVRLLMSHKQPNAASAAKLPRGVKASAP